MWDKDLNFLIRTVFRASKLAHEPFSVATKDAVGDLVTTADLEIERFIMTEIKREYPLFDIIGEEFNPTNQLSSNCFVIDPLDGTINFAHGLPIWGIQVAMVKKARVVASIIYLPALYEFYFACKDGAFLITNPTEETLAPQFAKKIVVSKAPPSKALYLVEGGDKFPALVRMNKFSRHWRYLCCTAVNSAWTAAGRLGGTILRKDNIWDWLPGQYLVEQAGGVVLNKKGAHIAANSSLMAKLLLKEARL